MRIWSVHPKYLDTKGLVALWRETLLAQKVLQGQTRGYTQHPQLQRFKSQKDPLSYIGTYLHFIFVEANLRGYQFNESKILKKLPQRFVKIPVTKGQVHYEVKHLKNKVKVRAPAYLKHIPPLNSVDLHPLFKEIPGNIEQWEIVS